MSLHGGASRVVAVAMFLALSAAQAIPFACMMPSVTAAEPAAVPSHEHHHGSSQQSTPVEDHDQPKESSHAGHAGCAMMLSCALVMAVPERALAEAVFDQSDDVQRTSSHSYVGPLLSRLTPPPRTA
jgi:hypothetical protein